MRKFNVPVGHHQADCMTFQPIKFSVFCALWAPFYTVQNQKLLLHGKLYIIHSSKSQNPNYSRHMDYGKLSIGNPGLLFLFLAGVFYVFVWSSTLTNPFSAFQESHCRLPNTVSFPAYIFLQTNMGDLNFSKEIRLKYFILADPD